ncbi:hypothetical protein BofuT4_P148330.1 [Botrytis cinerea T4]|uniref:Uncharacterized protein n=1 Tax=Botryotinia fuckeliana (strain T4) TaxID=999810 RepID=G2YWY5_BOTF4|nr:hypothetical protein BofuT4_P148330.1 [Botrytis cinerea T4]
MYADNVGGAGIVICSTYLAQIGMELYLMIKCKQQRSFRVKTLPRQLIGYLEIRLVKCNKMVSVAARCTRTGNGELAVFGGKHTACEEEEEMPLSFRRSVCTYVFEKEQYCVERELMLLSAVGGAPRPTITANRSLLCARRRFLKEGRLLPAA